MKSLNDLAAEDMTLFRQEELILEVTELLAKAMQQNNVSKAELARKLKRSKAFVTQCLTGEQNLTLRTVSDLFAALELKPLMGAEPIGRETQALHRLYPIGGWSLEQSCRPADEGVISCAAQIEDLSDAQEPGFGAAA